MPASDPRYYQQRYKEDAEYRTSVISATMRWQERQREHDPEAYAERIARGVARRREKYSSDPGFRERLLDAQRLRRRAARAASSGLNASEAREPEYDATL